MLFVPLATSHQFLEPERVLQALTAFLVFSLVASAVYLINDLVDLKDDRQHPRETRLAVGFIGSAITPKTGTSPCRPFASADSRLTRRSL
ncbi:hypothetical protein CKO14_11980 [Halorhodospira halophila]|nr:hypothetical protein [Halorhodospira halophila]